MPDAQRWRNWVYSAVADIRHPNFASLETRKGAPCSREDDYFPDTNELVSPLSLSPNLGLSLGLPEHETLTTLLICAFTRQERMAYNTCTPRQVALPGRNPDLQAPFGAPRLLSVRSA